MNNKWTFLRTLVIKKLTSILPGVMEFTADIYFFLNANDASNKSRGIDFALNVIYK